MATLSYPDQSTPYGATRAEAETRTSGRRDIAATIFVWLAWAAAAFFWGMTLTTAFHIIGTPAPNQAVGPGEVDQGGVGWGLMNFVGVIILGLAIAYGMFRYVTRDKRKDAITEASTHALYDRADNVDRHESSLSPEAHEPEERAAYRDAISPER
jgi:hypothetical protein